MEALNDDTLMCILSYLDLKSQQSMISLHPRFYHLMSLVWSSQYKTVILSLYEANFAIDHLQYFFESIHKTVQVLHLRMMSLEQYQVLTSFTFPKVHDFRFATVPSKMLSDSDIPKIIETFPNLKTFSPQGNFSGQYFTDFPFLERLTLTYCKEFYVENLANIMKAHKLKEIKLCLFDRRTIESSDIILPVEYMLNLESIKIELDELPWFEDHLCGLAYLNKLIVCGPRYIGTLNSLCRKLRGSLFQKHHFNILETCNATDTLCTVIESKLRVDALKIVTDNYLLEDMGNFSTKNFEYIQQLFFKSCCIQERNHLNSLMHNVANVELVSFEQCVFRFNNYEFVASKITEKRSKILQINLHQNSCLLTKQDWLWTQVGQHPLLQFLPSRNYEYTYEPIYMTFK